MQSTSYGKPERRWRITFLGAIWLAEIGAILLVWYIAVTLMLAEGVL